MPQVPAPRARATDEAGSIPKHKVVRSYLSGLIESELSPGDPIPSERALAARFGVARMTVRHAVDRLVAEGRLKRMRPVGTFVTEPPEQISLGSGTLIEAVEARGRQHRYRVIGRYTIDASEDVAAALGIAPGARVHVVRRIRLAGEDPLAVESVHFPASLAPTGPRLADHHVDDVLRQRYGVVVDHVEQVVEAVVLASGSARVLDVPELSPALTLRRRALAQGTPVAFSIATYRADRCRLHVDPPAST
jgi:GntR family transcriptional regulator